MKHTSLLEDLEPEKGHDCESEGWDTPFPEVQVILPASGDLGLPSVPRNSLCDPGQVMVPLATSLSGCKMGGLDQISV